VVPEAARIHHLAPAVRLFSFVVDLFLTVRMNYRNLSRLTLLARRVVEDPEAAYRGNVLERIYQFTKKFEDLALRLKVRSLSY
jgi:hypothetical protein